MMHQRQLMAADPPFRMFMSSYSLEPTVGKSPGNLLTVRFQCEMPISSSVGLFGIVRVTDRLSQTMLQLGAAQDDLLRMY